MGDSNPFNYDNVRKYWLAQDFIRKTATRNMTAHEFGGMYRRRRYPKRPLMGPTLNKTAPQLPKLWENAVKKQ